MNAERVVRVLVVEDHTALAANLLEYFADDRYALDFAPDGLTALHLVATNEYDVIVLDIMLPGVSGLEVCRLLRRDARCAAPVIMMTAKDQLRDKEQGFAAGADDYLVKPFDLRELQLRIDALFRRRSGFPRVAAIQVPGIRFDPGTLTVDASDGTRLELTGTMARLFEELIRAYPDFLSYAQIQDRIWVDKEVDMNTLRTHVYSLRKLLQDTFGRPMIRTLHGRGYQLLARVPAKDGD